MADQNPYRQAREVENDALGRMTGPSPKEVGWDEGFAAARAAATPDPDATAVLAAVKAIIDEPLDERDGHGPTRTGQFARIDALLRDRPTTADAPRDPRVPSGLPIGYGGPRAAATPDPPHNPYREACEAKAAMGRADFAHYARDADVWDEAVAACAAATPDPPDESHAVKCAEARGYARGRFERDPAASPDERLREALREIVDTAPGIDRWTIDRRLDDEQWTGKVAVEVVRASSVDVMVAALRAALAAADREKPDEPIHQPDPVAADLGHPEVPDATTPEES